MAESWLVVFGGGGEGGDFIGAQLHCSGELRRGEVELVCQAPDPHRKRRVGPVVVHAGVALRPNRGRPWSAGWTAPFRELRTGRRTRFAASLLLPACVGSLSQQQISDLMHARREVAVLERDRVHQRSLHRDSQPLDCTVELVP
jgi:hypothetical protein